MAGDSTLMNIAQRAIVNLDKLRAVRKGICDGGHVLAGTSTEGRY
jgi:hypothetical protein